ncbi:sensor histidine kinase [Vibrio cholerae]|uniref:sensor histidine kinase n=1 Tax=Vibrio cholerae TaxID=666 RepID=UPI00129A1CF5|nr:sensor histidine kinase [Vibrio cholerae]MRI16925.1 sensor histidine kinase [Vibrio cholerae]
MPSIRRLSLMLWVMFIVLVSMSTHLYWRFQYQALLNEHQSQLDRFSSHIVATLDKYAHIPHLISKDKELVDALLSAQNSAQIDITNRYLEQVNEVIQAADTYLIDRFGNTIASSNWNLDRSFIGRNFAWRPYFYLSIAGQKSQYFALGSTSGQRGYYYAYPVIYAAEILGVIVVKMDLSAIEQGWQSKSSYFVATDDHQVVFMSSQPAWLFHSVADLSPAQLNDIRQSQQYLDSPIPSLGWQGDLQAEQSEWRKPEKHWLQDDYIVSSRPLPELALTIRVLSPKIELFWSAFGLVIILCMLFAIVYLGFQLWHHRQLRQRQIEHALRQTQDELIQAAKLAVLGQMSASISHELNNPLAAIRSFADNGRRFLATNKPERAEENLSRISALTERMAKISEQLKSFARKSTSNEQQDVQLYPLILSAKELMTGQFKAQMTLLELCDLETPVWVRVNPIQLEQVLINLLTNALQALEGQAERVVQIRLQTSEQQIALFVDDNGPGVGIETLPHLFEPFHTTKKNGLGLGLSISQQILHSMQGTLSVATSPLGGARFTITLPRFTPLNMD